MTRLSIRNLHAVLSGREVVSGVNLEVGPGELVVVVGPNGAGKTTLLRSAIGLHPVSRGESRLDGEPAHRVDPAQRALKLGYLPQERRLSWGLRAEEVAALGAPLEPPAIALERARAALAMFEIEALARTSVFALSGGERARVLLARLFATQAPLLVADEPVAGLDPEAQLLCLERLRGHADQGGAVLVTLHDLDLAARFADRIAVLDGGKLMLETTPKAALSPDILRDVFRVDGRWVNAGGVDLLRMERRRD